MPDDAVNVEVGEEETKYKIINMGGEIEWITIDYQKEMESHLLKRNKRHLQQVAKEESIPLQSWFRKIIGKMANQKKATMC